MQVLSWKFHHLFFLLLCAIFVIIIIFQKVLHVTVSNKFYPRSGQMDRVKWKRNSHASIVNTTKTRKKILLWNTFFADPYFSVGELREAVFHRTKCPHVCYLTRNKSALTSADAVLVHTYNMDHESQNSSMPHRMNQKQIFVFFIVESPLRSYNGFYKTDFGFTDTFNLTFTYLRSPNTDIYTPLGGIEKKAMPHEGAIPNSKSLARKSKMVAWFISNCNAPSARMDYARQLSRYVQVDVYGRCGNLTCEKGNRTCIKHVRRTYMFYLAFENSFCEDYATEKVFRTLKLTMVPIVYGYANYTELLPPNSYIDVRDYDSPKALAEYLHYLNKNRTNYGEYFSWKKYYNILMESNYRALGFCRLCSILNDERYPYKTRFDPVNDYWNPKYLCLPKDEEKRAVHLSN